MFTCTNYLYLLVVRYLKQSRNGFLPKSLFLGDKHIPDLDHFAKFVSAQVGFPILKPRFVILVIPIIDL